MARKAETHFDVICFGAATQDTFLISKEFAAYRDRGENFLVIPAAVKLDIPDIATDIGGGATNAATTFARAGLKAACVAKVGADGPGREVAHALQKEKIHDLLVIDRGHQTGVSVVLKGPNGEDTILTHRGAGYEYKKTDCSLEGLHASWLYISSLGGDLTLLQRVLRWAKLQGVRVAVNPGSLEIAKRLRLIRLLRQADVVILNQTEATELFISDNPEHCFQEARLAGWHTMVITDSAKGSWVLDGSYLYRTGISKNVKVIDRTGAGDAYGSGLIAAIMRGLSMQEAISYAAANATSVIGYVGAKTGILRGAEVDIMDIKVSVFESLAVKQERFHVSPH